MAEVDDILAQLDTSRPIYVPKKSRPYSKLLLKKKSGFNGLMKGVLMVTATNMGYLYHHRYVSLHTKERWLTG